LFEVIFSSKVPDCTTFSRHLKRACGTVQPTGATPRAGFLAVRNGAIHILDYKPDARTNKPFAQLTIYALALTRLVPGLRLFDIKCAWFNDNCYCEFFPRKLLPRPK
jgi:hypothetical protein